jgi:hypothetical protein
MMSNVLLLETNLIIFFSFHADWAFHSSKLSERFSPQASRRGDRTGVRLMVRQAHHDNVALSLSKGYAEGRNDGSI